jgi:O-antigen/teichoic acid export membrane protein
MPHLLRYTLSHAPWMLISSLSHGVSNYIIIILLAKFYGLAAGGQFRLLLSIVSLLSTFTLLDSGKVVIRHLVMQRPGVVRPLLIARVLGALAGLSIGVIAATVLHWKGDELWLPMLMAALLLPVTFPPDLYAQVNQAKKQFHINAIYNVARYSTLTLMVLVLGLLRFDVMWLFAAYFAVFAVFNLFYLMLCREAYEPSNPEGRVFIKETVQLSGSGVFPIIIENADKILISYFLGLEALGLYAIGVSTGKILLNFIRPALTIYFPILVNRRVDGSLLLRSFLALSTIGLTIAVLMKYYFAHVLGPEHLNAYPVAAVIVGGLGLYFVGVLSYYSSVYHKDSTIIIPSLTNIISSVLVISYLVAAILQGGEHVLLLCAASYPLREFIKMCIIVVLSRKEEADAKPGAVL